MKNPKFTPEEAKNQLESVVLVKCTRLPEWDPIKGRWQFWMVGLKSHVSSPLYLAEETFDY